MADPLDAPGLKSPGMNARIDITDIYAFQKPGDPSKSILILNVNPLAPTLAKEFDPTAVYELKIDINGDAVADIAFRVTFSEVEDGQQFATVRRATATRRRGRMAWSRPTCGLRRPHGADAALLGRGRGPRPDRGRAR